LSIALMLMPVRSLNRRIEAAVQAQGVEHELKAHVLALDFALFLHWRTQFNLLHVGLRLLVAGLAQDAVRERQLGVRAGADAEVVAELPVIQIVARAVAFFA
jgi:hypothetical protein